MTAAQKDNLTYRLKVRLRKNALSYLNAPVVMETHGGYGAIYQECYARLGGGVVFEKDPAKAEALGRQRPEWAVYECDCEMAIRAGAGLHLPVNFYDLDPYGSPWPVLDAILSVKREWPQRIVVVVNDGLQQKAKMGGSWDVSALQGAVARYGTGVVYRQYLDICRELLEEKVRQVGYDLSHWGGYYCGYMEQITHYAAVLERGATDAA